MFVPVEPRLIAFTKRKQGVFWNARQTLNEAKLKEIRESIRKIGLNQPPVVRTLPEGRTLPNGKQYELICGEQRMRSIMYWLDRNVEVYNPVSKKLEPAAKVYRTIHCRVEQNCSDERACELSVAENMKRGDVSDVDLMQYCLDLVDLGFDRSKIATVIDRSESWISQTLSLYKLSDRAKAMLGADVLPRTTALYLLKIDPSQVDVVLDRAQKIADMVHSGEIQQLEKEIVETEEMLDTADIQLTLANRIGSTDDKKEASKSASMLARKLEEAQTRQTGLRARKPRITTDTLQNAADAVPSSRVGKSNVISHKVIRTELELLNEKLAKSAKIDNFDERDVRLVQRMMEMMLGQTDERKPLDLLSKFYQDEGR